MTNPFANLGFDRRQKILLTVFFILGLPMICMVPVIWFTQRVLFEDQIFAPERRAELVQMTICWMFALTVFVALFVVLPLSVLL